MFLTGFADEAGGDFSVQIKATCELGWKFIESRGINGKNLATLSDEEFESGRNEDGYFGTWDVPEFFIDALYIEDNDLSQNLLCMPFATS